MKTAFNFSNYPLRINSARLNAHLTGIISAMLLIVIAFSSCKKENNAAEVSSLPNLTTSASTIVLNRNNAAQPALTLNWSAASVKGMDGTITYFLQWDRKGNNFNNPTNITIGKSILKAEYTQGSLNDMVSTLPAGIATAIEVRVVGATSDGSVAPFYSNVIGLTITAYAKDIPPPYNQLWIVGDATPNGWDIGNATPMLQNGTDPYIFTYTGNLIAGEFKIPTAKSFDAQFYRPTVNHPALSAATVQLNAGDPDHKWQIVKASKYQITLNLRTLTISITDMNAGSALPPFSKLWIIGDATPTGWSIDAPTSMVQDSADPFIFSYTGPLTAGEFKIPTAKSFDAAFYRPKTNHPSLSATDVQLSAGDPDNKWQVTASGNYRILLNLRDVTISIVKL